MRVRTVAEKWKGFLSVTRPHRRAEPKSESELQHQPFTSNANATATMILRVLLPQRAQRLISPIWTRAFASQIEPNPTPEQKDPSPPENAAAGRLRVLRMKGGIRDPPSKLHWVLSDIYTEGGKLPSTPNRDVNTAVEDTRDYLGRKIPLWGKKQVSLRIRTGEEGSRINLWVSLLSETLTSTDHGPVKTFG